MKQLGKQCPECKTTDAPQILAEGTTRTRESYLLLGCMRCGRTACGAIEEEDGAGLYSKALPLALAAFYGPQPEREGPTPVFGIAPEVRGFHTSLSSQWWLRWENSGGASIQTGNYYTEAEALAAWEELVGGGR